MLSPRSRSAVMVFLALAGCSEEDPAGDGSASGAGGGASASVGTASSTVATSGGGGEAPQGVPGIVGRACKDDGDCAPGRCIQSTVFDSTFGGAPARGYCTLPCVSELDCPDPGSSCLKNFDGEGKCLLGCTYGEPALKPTPQFVKQPLDPDKCHGREDVGCLRLASGLNACWPVCSGDAQCEGGLECDPFLWSCVEPKSKTQGGAFGSECTKSAPPPECEGHCIGVGPTTMCSQACPIGGVLDTATTVCGGLDRGACVAQSDGIGLGDVGFCGATCKQQDDCRTPDLFCFEYSLPGGHGICAPSQVCTSETSCAVPGATCVETSLGSYCMSASFPLGSIAPM